MLQQEVPTIRTTHRADETQRVPAIKISPGPSKTDALMTLNPGKLGTAPLPGVEHSHVREGGQHAGLVGMSAA